MGRVLRRTPTTSRIRELQTVPWGFISFDGAPVVCLSPTQCRPPSRHSWLVILGLSFLACSCLLFIVGRLLNVLNPLKIARHYELNIMHPDERRLIKLLLVRGCVDRNWTPHLPPPGTHPSATLNQPASGCS